MSLLKEDGSQVVGAVVYVDETDLNEYADARGVTISGDEAELLMGTVNYIDTLAYEGMPVSSTQRLPFPRYGVVVDGVAIGSDEIPRLLKDLQCEVALFHDRNGDPLINLERLATSESVGDLSQSFSEKSPVMTDYSPIIKRMANQLIGISVGGLNVAVTRG